MSRQIGDGEITKIGDGEEDPRMEALTAVDIIHTEGATPRRDIQALKDSLMEIMRGNGDEIPDNILTKDAKMINQVSRVIMRFDETAGRSNWTPQPIEYFDGVSDDVAEMFCRGIPMPPPKTTQAKLDDLLVHMSQIFDLRRKASFIHVLKSGILERALGHVSPESNGYDKFKESINTAEYLLCEISSSPASSLATIITEARMIGIDRTKVADFVASQQANKNIRPDEDMGELPEILDSSEPDEKTTLYIEHDGGQLSLDLP